MKLREDVKSVEKNTAIIMNKARQKCMPLTQW